MSTSSYFRFLSKWILRLAATGLIVLLIGLQVAAVPPGVYHKLTKDEFLKLDFMVADFFSRDYRQLDTMNVTYDAQLLTALKSIRHTIVMSQLEYYYSKPEMTNSSVGALVDETKCARQLQTMVTLTRKLLSNEQSEQTKQFMPISLRNMLDANGRAESGPLNGNFIWWGSPASCDHALLSSDSIRRVSSSLPDEDIRGRMCMGHLKARSWPQWDKYFENRLNIKTGICLPDTCHTNLYLSNENIRRDVDYLARVQLLSPFNSDRYEISYLYCSPDEDSPARRWDLGTKLFVLFVIVWFLVLAHTNYRYHQRLKAVRRLRESVDIRMIIKRQRRGSLTFLEQFVDDRSSVASTSSACSDYSQQDQADQSDACSPVTTRIISATDEPPASSELKAQPGIGSLGLPKASSRHSSASASPMPSDIEENDGDFNGIRPIVVDQRSKRTSNQKQTSPWPTETVDFVRAFSVKANLEYLFKSRAGEAQAKELDSHQHLQMGALTKRFSQQLSAAARRISASNEQLIKELQRGGDTLIDKSLASKVQTIVSTGQGEQKQLDETTNRRRRRVNIDVFDGIKAICTCYIVYGHTMMLFFGLVTDIRFGDERMLDYTMISVLNTVQVVGLFYIITGALVAYLMFSRQTKSQIRRPTFWLVVIVGRYLRLMPTYMLVFWFARHVAPFTGSGINWFDYRTDTGHHRTICGQQSWLTMWTMSAADVKIPTDCVPQAWYLSNDFRTLLVLPIYLAIMATNVKAGYAAIVSTMVVSTVRLVHILRAANVDYSVILLWQPHVYAIMADRLHDVYTDLTTRLSTYLLGIVVGHLLYLYETRQIKRWPRLFQKLGMKVGLSIGGLAFFAAPLVNNPIVRQFLPSADGFDSDTAVWLIPLFKLLMESSICIVLILLVSNGGYSWVREALSSKPAKILSNISYGVFLVHVELMYKMPALKIESSYWYLFVFASFFIVASNILSFFIYILYEMPINNILRTLFKRVLKLFN